jgi:hypothetical protein
MIPTPTCKERFSDSGEFLIVRRRFMRPFAGSRAGSDVIPGWMYRIAPLNIPRATLATARIGLLLWSAGTDYCAAGTHLWMRSPR